MGEKKEVIYGTQSHTRSETLLRRNGGFTAAQKVTAHYYASFLHYTFISALTGEKYQYFKV